MEAAAAQVAIERAVQAAKEIWGWATITTITSGEAVDGYEDSDEDLGENVTSGEAVDEDENVKDDLLKHHDRQFNEDAIRSLDEWLLRERECSTAANNLLYLWVDTITPDPSEGHPNDFTMTESWLELDLPNASFSFLDSVMTSDELKKLTGYSCAVWKSNIVIVGGMDREYKPHRRSSDIVYIYDTVRKSWDKHQMKARRHSPIVVVADDKIFVFGGHPNPVDPTEFDHYPISYPSDWYRYGYRGKLGQQLFTQWCEYFDFKSGTPLSSNYLPKPPPPYMAAKAGMGSHTVYPKKSLILFWAGPLCIVSLNYNTWEWQPFLHLNMPIFQDLTGTAAQVLIAHAFCAQVVVLEDFLFWSNHTSIYAMDLSVSGHTSLPVYTFPHSESLDEPFRLRRGFPYEARHRFLVHVGNGVLCLLGDTHQSEIWFATFAVQVSKGDEAPTLHLVLDQAGFLEVSAASIAHVFRVSS